MSTLSEVQHAYISDYAAKQKVHQVQKTQEQQVGQPGSLKAYRPDVAVKVVNEQEGLPRQPSALGL